MKADSEEREALLAQGEPFFMPRYVGNKGWFGMKLDQTSTDWNEVAELIATVRADDIYAQDQALGPEARQISPAIRSCSALDPSCGAPAPP